MPTLTKAAALQALDALQAREFFIGFMEFAKVRSDDPVSPVVMDWQPWDYLVEQGEAWQTGASEVILKDRQLGYSWHAGGYAVWRARKGATVALISKGDLYAHELLAKCAFIEQHLPRHLRTAKDRDIKTEEMKFTGGGIIRAFPSTPDAGIGFTNQVVIMDEAAFHPFAGPNYAALRPTVSAGGQFIILSTADPELGSFGWFPDFYWASKRGETGYASRFVPWNVRPGRDAAWLERERRAYKGMPEHFDAYYADTDAQAFAGKSGLVYPQFTDAHVAPAPWRWQDSVRRVAGVDFGGGDPTAVVPLGLSGRGHVHQFAELYQRGPVSVYDIAHFLAQWPGPGVVVCDPSEPVAIASLSVALQGTGWSCGPANNKRGEGLGLVGMLLDEHRLTIEPSCTSSIAEFPGYRWASRTDPNDKTRYQTSTPVANHADAHDARRYAAVELLAMLGPMIQMPTHAMNTGRPLARRAV